MRDEWEKLGDVAADIVTNLHVPPGVESFPAIDRAAWLEMRKRDVTASVAAALFGGHVHPYSTAFGVWAEKRGIVGAIQGETPAMRRGRLLEPVALEMLREERPEWVIQPSRKYYRDPAARIGATPDALATRPDEIGVGNVQIKTIGHFAFKQSWKTPEGDVEVPLWIAVQASVEAALTGARWAVVAALALGDGGLEMHVEEIPLKPKLMVELRRLAADFWRRVDENDPYPIDYDREGDLVRGIYADDNGSVADLSGNNRICELLADREKLQVRERDGRNAGDERKTIDAEIIHALGNAARGRLADGRVVEAPTTRRKAFAVAASSFRTVRVKGGAPVGATAARASQPFPESF